MVQQNIFNLFSYSKNLRTSLLKKNLILIALLRGLSVFLTFLLVPMTIDYLNPTEYGVWLTLNSISVWTYVFDFGLGRGLQNKIAEAYAVNDLGKIRVYVSTSYCVLTVLSLFIFLIFLIFNHFVKWDTVFNIDALIGNELSRVLVVVMFFYCLAFVIRIIDTIVAANQHPVFSVFNGVLGYLFSLIAIYYLISFTEGSLLYVSIAFLGIPLIVSVLFSILLFTTKYKQIRPSFKLIQFKPMKEILDLGSKFFVIQISSLLLLSSSNIIISIYLTPNDVTIYNLAYKYFTIVTIVFNIIITPLWSAITDAYILDDQDWIRNIVSKMKLIWIVTIVLSVTMLLLSDTFYFIWIGDSLKIPFDLSLIMSCYVVIFNLYNLYTNVISGIGKILILFMNSVIISIFLIPTIIYFCNCWNLVGVVLAIILMLLPSIILLNIQYNKLTLKKSSGIWNK